MIKITCPGCKKTIEINPDLPSIMCNYCGYSIKDNKSGTIKNIADEVKKEIGNSRKYHSTYDYKKKLDIQRENTEAQIKMLIKYFLILSIIMILLFTLVKILFK